MADEESPSPCFVVPGAVVKGFDPDTTDATTLRMYFDTSMGGRAEVANVEFSANRDEAHVKFKNHSDLAKVQSMTHTLRGHTLTVQAVNLLEVWQPHIVVKDLPGDFMDAEILQQHFESATKEEVDTVRITQSEVIVTFKEPNVCLQVVEMEGVNELFGSPLSVEVGYAPQEQCVLRVANFPSSLPLSMLKKGLKLYFEKAGYAVEQCEVIEDNAYVKFSDSSVPKVIVSQPPTAGFYGGCSLKLSTAPLSESPWQYQSAGSLPQKQLEESAEHSITFVVGESSAPAQREQASLGESPASMIPPPSQDVLYRIAGHDSAPVLSTSPEHWAHRSLASEVTHSQSESSFGPSSSFGSYKYPDVTIQDIETSAVAVPPTRLRIENFPSDTKAYELEMFVNSLCPPGVESCVTVHGAVALAKFKSAIDVEGLLCKSKAQPFPQTQTLLSLTQLGNTNTMLVSNLPEGLKEFVLDLHFKKQGHQTTSIVVDADNAFVTFTDTKSVLKVTNENQYIGGSLLTVEEYYPFMNVQTSEKPSVGATARLPMEPWNQYIEDTQVLFLQNTIDTLNIQLGEIKGQAVIENTADSKCLCVRPLEGANETSKWKEAVEVVVQNHFKNFKTISHSLCEFKMEIMEFVIRTALSEYPDVSSVLGKEDTITLSGAKIRVDELYQKITGICDAARITSKEVSLPRKHIKFLKQFYSSELNAVNPPVVEYHYNVDAGTITVLANQNGHLAFEQVVKDLLHPSNLIEEMLRLPSGAYALLSSTSNMNKMLGSLTPKLVVELEKEQHSDGSVEHKAFFLSKERSCCRQAFENVAPFMTSSNFEVTQKKIRVCSTQEWKTLVQGLCREFVVDVDVNLRSQTITLTGSRIHREKTETRIKKFLSDHTHVEEHVHFNTSEWKVIYANAENEVKDIKRRAKAIGVSVEYSKSAIYEHPVYIKGEPDHVDDIKAQITRLREKYVCKTEKKISHIAGLLHVLGTFDDKIDRLERDYKSVIELSIETACTEPSSPVSHPHEVFCAVASSSGIRISVFTGELTKQQEGTILNFVSPNPSFQSESTLKVLGNVAGKEMKHDFRYKLSQFTRLKPPDIFKTKIGCLQCSELLHAVLPEWDNGDHSKEDILAESLQNAFYCTKCSEHIVILPMTSFPLQYPVKIYANAVVKQVTRAAHSNIRQVSVFVEHPIHTKEFEELLIQSGDFMLQYNANGASTPVDRPVMKERQTSSPQPCRVKTRSITSAIGSFVTVKHGDMLDEPADVYVNSTNSQMDLSQGQLSSKLLKLSGPDLQKDCQQLAPLNPGSVAVTDAKNLKCTHLFHVALPDYKSRGSEWIFRETIRNILNTAREKKIQSIVIPSLGAANLNYPPERSAQITFDEVIAFHSKYPLAIQSICFVVYDHNVYRVFNQQYVNTMSARSSAPTPDENIITADCPITQLSVVQGDISEEKADVIVNTTSEDMNLMSNAVSRSILKKAGPMLQNACKQLVNSGLNLHHGEIADTQSFGSLHCGRVVHAHVPPHSSTIDHSGLIEDIVTKCLNKAEGDGMKAISFPAFGIGQGGYSVAEAAVPMLKAFKKFGDSKPRAVEAIRVVILDDSLYKQFCEQLNLFFGLSSGRPRNYSLGNRLEAELFGTQKDLGGTSVDLQPGSLQLKTTRPPLLKALSQTIAQPVAVFTIISASVQTCERVAGEIEASIKAKITIDKLECAGFSQFLMDKDVEELETLRNDYGVEIEFESQIIQISGVKDSIPEAKMRLMDIIQKIEVAKAYLQFYEWKGNHSYTEDFCVQLERAKSEGIAVLEAIIDSHGVVFNLQKMEEIDKETGTVYPITRLKKIHNDYPSTWEPQPVENDKEKACHMFDVPSGSPEYQDAIKEFEQTIGALNYTIVNVQRVQCPMEYPKHVALRTAMQKKHHKPADERRLFHGTKKESIELIAVQGFNRVYAADANAAIYGKGVYFAVTARYSSQRKYAIPDKTGNQYMFLCNVLVGEYTQGKKTMKAAPEIPGGTEHIQFDTLCDNPKNPTIFVAMSDAQAYPLYLITFRIN